MAITNPSEQNDQEIKTSIRLSKELLNALQERTEKGQSVSDLIRQTLIDSIAKKPESNAIPTEASFTEKAITIAKPTTPTRSDFIIPVGDVICRDTNPQTQLWWCPVEWLRHVERLCAEWVKNGFELHYGTKGCGSALVPEIIETESQERKQNGCYCRSTRGVEARIGDVLIWLEINDASKARAYMAVNTAIPVAVRCDVHKYMSDNEYRDAFDMSNSYFITYFVNKRPKALKTSGLTHEDFCEMYDV